LGKDEQVAKRYGSPQIGLKYYSQSVSTRFFLPKRESRTASLKRRV